MKVAICLTVKATDDEAPLLEQCLKSVAPYVDGIFIQLNAPKGKKISNKVRAVAERYTKPHNIEVFTWTGNFAKAKQANLEQVPKKYDWVMWLDTDDTVENPEKIKEVLSITPKNRHGIYVLYDYAHDEWGNTVVAHWNCRIIRNDGSFAWKSSIDDSDVSVHETLVPKRSVAYGYANEFKVVHHDTPERRLNSKIRNLELLEGMYERHKSGRLDPRVLFYLGRDYFNAGELEKSQARLYEYLQLSGWAEERSEAHLFMGKIFNAYGKSHQAKTAYLQALGENNQNASAYLELARLDATESRPNQAIFWLKSALKIKQGPQAMDLFTEWPELYMLLAECYLELGGKDLSEALKWADKGLSLRPLDPEFIAQRDKISNVIEYREDMKAAARLVRKLKVEEKDKVIGLIESLPKDIADSPVVAATKLEFKPTIKWPKKSMAIYCGASPLGIWGPWSLKEGIGGSEEAVIQLSKELTKLGWQVVVYATPGERAGDYQGVIWRQYWEFNPGDKFNVLVAWRMPSFFDAAHEGRAYLWLHDVMELSEFTEERLANLDKVIVLSDYHRSLFPTIPDKKIFLSANGIDPHAFRKYDGKFKRDPHRIIYMSSHIRGLALLYDIWPEVKKAVPKATLDIYYGWQSYIDMNHNNPGNQPGGMGWMRMMQAWERKLEGVTDHGKIGHEQIIQEIFKSGIWAYPCPFPEIYSITAVKAQAGGAVPVSSNFAALRETVRYGAILPMAAQDEDTPVGHWDKESVEQYKIALIDMLKLPKEQEQIRPEMMHWARKQSWASVARAWDSEMS